jgi:hypothetical protein
MPDDLHDDDILFWSEYQANLLCHLGRGEGVNGIDWEHVAEEIQDVGLSELHAAQNYLNLMLVHLMQIWLPPHLLAASCLVNMPPLRDLTRAHPQKTPAPWRRTLRSPGCALSSSPPRSRIAPTVPAASRSDAAASPPRPG